MSSYQGLALLLARQEKFADAKAVLLSASEQPSSDAEATNGLAWLLATSEFQQVRDPALAVRLAQKAVDLAPTHAHLWNTLGAAQYRAGDWQGSISSLMKAEELSPESSFALNGFFLAMAHWQLGQKDEARHWYDRSIEWMEKHRPKDKELSRFRTEAAQLLGMPVAAISNACPLLAAFARTST
jgi:Flp pilus assembly protein TadD